MAKRIKEELTAADVVVLLLTKTSIERLWINFEAGAAWILDRTILPVCFGGFSHSDLPRPYSDFTAVNLTNADAAYDMVKGICEHCLALTPFPPSLEVKLKSILPTEVIENNEKYAKLLKVFAQ